MEQPKKIITITYECDVYGNHDCLPEDLHETSTKVFNDPMEAIHFIGECTSCKHNLRDVHPKFFFWENEEEDCTLSNYELEQYRINNNY